jgi:PKD repeat protein
MKSNPAGILTKIAKVSINSKEMVIRDIKIGIPADDAPTIPPISGDFTYINTKLNVDFSTTASAPYDWAFGDGLSDNIQNPTHEYGIHGTYDVELTSGGGVINKPVLVSGNRLPSSFFTFVGDKLEASFTAVASDKDGDPITYLWDFGDTNSSTDENPVHNYTVGGFYEVMLRVQDSVGAAYAYKETIEINDAPVADFSEDILFLDVDFTNLSTDPEGDNMSNSWDFGDGDTTSAKDPSHTYDPPTIPNDPLGQTFTVTLTVEDTFGNQSVKEKDITVYDFELLGTNLVNNPSFDTPDLSHITTPTSTIQIIDDAGTSALEITGDTGSQGRIDMDVSGLEIGKSYRVAFIIRMGTGDINGRSFKNFLGLDPSNTSINYSTASSYTEFPVYMTATDTDVLLRVYVGATGNISYLDEVKVQEVI